MNKKQRRRRLQGKKKKGGTMMSMRSGFKNVANSVAGTGEKKAKKNTWLSTLITLVIVGAAVALFLNSR